MAKRPEKDCDGQGNCNDHPIMEFKSNLSMALLGANLLGVVVIAAMVGWANLKAMPEMEDRIAKKLEPIIERVARLEQWKETQERMK